MFVAKVLLAASNTDGGGDSGVERLHACFCGKDNARSF